MPNIHARSLSAGVAVLALTAASAAAEDLTIALGSEITSVDPHYHNLSPNNAFTRHIFDRLILTDENQALQPGLATEWYVTDDPTVWEFKLREGVKFHNGNDFTAEDVAFTFERARDVPNSPSSFNTYLGEIEQVEVVDDHTVRVHTAEPAPLVPNNVANVAILDSEVGEGATTEDYNDGSAAIGTGPYEFVEWVPGDRIVIEANEDYWGGAPQWDTVTFKPITSDPARVAALLAGDVDLIEQTPTADIPNLKGHQGINLSSGISNRVIYLHVDSDRDESPFVKAKDGAPLTPNPLKDAKVREAMSLAINRDAIVERIMDGLAVPAGQLLPDGFFGTVPDMGPDPYDPEGAQELLAEAGYPDGFALTIHGPNDRYINDADIAQAVAQMLTRVGIDTAVETMPRSVFFSNASNLDYSFILVGWGSGTGEASSPLKSLLSTHDQERGYGASNRGRYSNPEVDRLVKEALATVDDAKREQLLQEATELALGEYGIIPLHFQVNTWAMDDAFTYEPRTDEATLAMSVKKNEG